jgi:TPR repeat protein
MLPHNTTWASYCTMGVVVDKDLQEATRWYRLAAAQDYKWAQYALAVCLQAEGHHTEAIKLLQLAAAQGHPNARNCLGVNHHLGNGVTRSMTEAVKLYNLAANQPSPKDNCPSAQYNLGVCYMDGTGVARNVAEAIRLFELASNQGLALAQTALGQCYAHGHGVAVNHSEAVHYFMLAARKSSTGGNGSAKAQYCLGECYQLGRGVGVDIAEAVTWYKLSAEQGNMKAEFGLGHCYLRGVGVDKNLHEAVRLFSLAAGKGESNALFYLGLCHAEGFVKAVVTEGAAEKSPEEIRTDQLLDAVRMYTLAASNGHVEATYNLGKFYKDGTGVPVDHTEAARLFRVAAGKNHAHAQLALANCYRKGLGVGVDNREAVRLYKLAANSSHEDVSLPAQYNLGAIYHRGTPDGAVLRDSNESLKYFTLAGQQGHAGAQFALGLHHQYEQKKLAQALFWYQLAADQGHPQALNNLAVCIEKGIPEMDVVKDKDEAMRLYVTAAGNGSIAAKNNLDRVLT